MKVKIGPYLNWWGPYQIAELLKYVGFKEKTYEKIGEKLAATKFADLCQWVHDKRKRKVEIKIERYDVWNMDSTLALLVLPMLKQLKEQKHGAPASMAGFAQLSQNSYPQMCFAFYEEGDEAADQAGFAEWDEIMNKMIWSFEQLLDEDSDSKFFENDTYDQKGYEAYAARMQEGFELFGKYYQSLWD
jgi:hypothetical protein